MPFAVESIPPECRRILETLHAHMLQKPLQDSSQPVPTFWPTWGVLTGAKRLCEALHCAPGCSSDQQLRHAHKDAQGCHRAVQQHDGHHPRQGDPLSSELDPHGEGLRALVCQHGNEQGDGALDREEGGALVSKIEAVSSVSRCSFEWQLASDDLVT